MKTEAARLAASRRRFLRAGLGSALTLLPAGAAVPWISHFASSRDRAYAFLDLMMDSYAAGETPRLIQSYSDQSFPDHPSVAFTYDNAVVLQAYLARGSPADLLRAQTLGKGLIAAQSTNFPVADGRFAQAYYVEASNAASGAYAAPAANPYYYYSSSVGDQAWAGIALVQLFHATKHPAYLTAALKVANWIVENAYSSSGPGGYSFGTTINAQNQSIRSINGKSTEHNIDTYTLFSMLAHVTKGGSASDGRSWAGLAQHASHFVNAMVNRTSGYLYTGTDGDQTTIAKANIPEDVQTWSFLAFPDERYARALDWCRVNLTATDHLAGHVRISGATFASESLTTSSDDPHAVWLEGTAHLAAALLTRRASGPARKALENIRVAQAKLGVGQKVNSLAIPVGLGIPASTSILDTGFGFKYSPDLHIGATGWYVLALLGANPFQLGFRLL